jgi:CHRD domain-containing protein
MTKIRFASLSLLALGAFAVACDENDLLSPTTATSFTADLNGAKEKPNPVTTTATGTATFTVNAARTEITYSVKVRNFTPNPTVCHIHFGTEDVAGSVLVTLCGTGLPAGPITAETEVAQGIITKGSTSTVKGSSPVSIATLLRMLEAGDVYVNVHSTANPGGEIRGQTSAVP